MTTPTNTQIEAGLREDSEPCPAGTPLNFEAMRRNRIERIYTAMHAAHPTVSGDVVERAIATVNDRFPDWKPSAPMLGYARAVGRAIAAMQKEPKT